MAASRIRTTKPEFWTDEKVSECSMSARLLFIASWNFADDKGGLERSAKQLKAKAFPYDDVDCEPLIQELLGAGLLIEYAANGKNYLHINGFLKHQKISHPSEPRVPVYEESMRVQVIITEPSGALRPDLILSEGIGMDLKGSKNQEAAQSAVGAGDKNVPQRQVQRTTVRDLRSDPHPLAGPWPHKAGELLPRMPRGAHAPDAPDLERAESLGTPEVDNPVLQPDALAPGKAGVGTVSDLREPGQPAAPSGLRQPEGGDLALSPVSPAAPRPDKRGTRLAETFTLPDDWRLIAKQHGLDPDRTFTVFLNYWVSKPGREACKLDWKRTWQNWCITEAQRQPVVRGRDPPMVPSAGPRPNAGQLVRIKPDIEPGQPRFPLKGNTP